MSLTPLQRDFEERMLAIEMSTSGWKSNVPIETAVALGIVLPVVCLLGRLTALIRLPVVSAASDPFGLLSIILAPIACLGQSPLLAARTYLWVWWDANTRAKSTTGSNIVLDVVLQLAGALCYGWVLWQLLHLSISLIPSPPLS